MPNILFCFDGDQAGRNAAWRALESALPNLKDGCKVRFLFLPEGEDPDSLVRAEGPDAFRARLVQQALPLAEYFFQQLKQEADPSTLEGKAHLATLAGPLLEKIPGNNLRLLMRQRLSEITGLSSEMLGQLSAPRPTASHSQDHDEHFADYSGYDTGHPGYESDSGHYQDAGAYFDTSSDFGNQKKEKKPWNGNKKWDKKGGRGDFAPRQPRTAVSVEPPTLSALRTLLHHPQLAQKVDNAGKFADEEHTYAQLLVALLDALQKSPNQSSMQLIARWHGTEQGRLLRALAEKEWLISADNLEQQFFDTITRLAASQRERSLEQLLRKARQSELSTEEKERLRDLLSRSVSPVAPTSSGA
ncbi:DNA primase [compost metagenome]